MMKRLRSALPSPAHALIGALAWAIVAVFSTVVMLVYYRGFLNDAQVTSLATIFGAGATISFPIALLVTNLAAPERSTKRTLIMGFALAIITIGATASIFALVYRDYYAQWHGATFSRLWFWQQLFTAAGAVYQYLVIGLRLYLPLAVIGLVALSLWANRLAR